MDLVRLLKVFIACIESTEPNNPNERKNLNNQVNFDDNNQDDNENSCQSSVDDECIYTDQFTVG